MQRLRVVIVGAGFAGLTVARALGRLPVEVVLVDRNNFHVFTPLLYQVASSLLDPSEIARPVRALIRPLANCEFRMATVTSVDFQRRRVVSSRGDLEYDRLVLASGSTNDHFGNRSIAEGSLGLKHLAGAMALRNRIIDRFERARWMPPGEARKTELTFAVVGGGPTGVEFAGALSELIRLVLRRDFKGFEPDQSRVVLMEAGERLLPAFDTRLGLAAARSLESKGVEVWLRAAVEEMRADQILLRDGRSLPAGSVVWTAGVRAAPVAGLGELEQDRAGRLLVGPHLDLPGHPEVFAIGDLAAGLPMLIPVAMQQAKHVGAVIAAELAGRPPAPFVYRDPGMMATIGRNSAVAQLGRLRLTGLAGWLLWLGVHLVNIISFRARLIVLLNWAWDYFLYDRPVRIMVRAEAPPGAWAGEDEPPHAAGPRPRPASS